MSEPRSHLTTTAWLLMALGGCGLAMLGGCGIPTNLETARKQFLTPPTLGPVSPDRTVQGWTTMSPLEPAGAAIRAAFAAANAGNRTGALAALRLALQALDLPAAEAADVRRHLKTQVAEAIQTLERQLGAEESQPEAQARFLQTLIQSLVALQAPVAGSDAPAAPGR